MSVTQYVGARYVPLFANPIDWDITKAYEPLTIVYYQGNSYTSKQSVPTGTDINNETYWALTGNYNAQIEQYRSEVVAAKTGADTANATNTTQDAQIAGTTDSGLKTLVNAEHTTNVTQDAQLAGTADSGLKTLIASNTSNIATNTSNIASNTTTNTEHTNQLAGTADSGLKALIDTNATYINETKKKTIVLLGDSYGEGYTPDGTVKGWCELVHDFLAPAGYDVHYAFKGGVGLHYANGYDTVLTTLLESDTTLDKNACKLVVIGGCYNDLNTTNTEIASFMSHFRTILANTFPNAKFVLAPFGNTVVYDNYKKVFSAYNNWAWSASQNGYGLIDSCNALLPSEIYYSSDGFHPNQNGQYSIAVPIASWIMSGSWTTSNIMSKFVSIPITSNSPIYESNVNKNIEFYYNVGKDKLNISTSMLILDIPNNAIPTMDNSLILLSEQENMFLMCYYDDNIAIKIPYMIVAKNASNVYCTMHGSLEFKKGKLYLRLSGSLNSTDTGWDNTFNPSHIDGYPIASACVSLGYRM